MKLLALLRRPPSCLLSPPSLFSPSLGGRLSSRAVSDPWLTAALLRSQIKWKSQRQILGSPNPALTTPGDLTGWGWRPGSGQPSDWGRNVDWHFSLAAPGGWWNKIWGWRRQTGWGSPQAKPPGEPDHTPWVGMDLCPLPLLTTYSLHGAPCPRPCLAQPTRTYSHSLWPPALTPAQPRSPSLALKGLA